jgi:tetratricopeptide (TPR) repeat protein
VETLADLGRVLRELRRRHARRRGVAELTYRELAAATGWSHGIIGEYLGGKVLPPTERFDALVRLLGATPPEQGVLATARDRVEERRRGAAPTGGAAESAVPRQLPADVFGFTGRSRELAELDQLLDQREQESAVVISAVCGTAGVGKTTLAVRWAHRVAAQFPDGQLYLDLRGYDPDQPVSPAAGLAAILRGLGLSAVDVPADLAERAARYRTLLADRRMLVVLDNARTADQVRPLLPGSRSCMVVVTSRDDLAGLVVRDGARRIDLDVLTEGEAVTLLRVLVGARIDAEPAAAAALAHRCARLPLALRIAAEIAAAHADVAIAELLAELGDEHHRLDRLDATGDPRTAVRAVFSWSYQNLSADGARAFGLLGLHPGRYLDDHALAALAGIAADRARHVMAELARAHLIEPVDPAGHTMHDLLRAYAVECPCADESHGADRRAALTQPLDHYRCAARLATQTLFPHDQRPDLAPIHSPMPAVDDPEQAQRWLDEQRANLVAVAVHAARHGWPEHTVDLSQILWRYFEVGGHYQDALAVHTSAAGAVAPDDLSRAAVLANLGGIHWWLGRYSDALVHFGQSLAGHRAVEDHGGEARALARLGIVHERLGDYSEALDRLRDSLSLYRKLGNRHGEGAQLVNIGSLYRRIGRYEDAAEHQRQAAAVFVEIGDVRLQGYALGNLGAVYSLLGRHPEALAHLEHSLANCLKTADRGGEGSALGTIGAAHARAGRPAEALGHLHRALAISRETADRSLETETLNTLGATLRAMKECDAALARHRAALVLASQTGDRYEQARARDGMAHALRDAGRAEDAREQWRQALAIYSALGVPEADQVRANLGG